MNKINYVFVVALMIFSFMTVQSLIPVFANSSTATIIGGATNGNIFGSIQYDELNVTDTGVWRFDTAGGPVIATFTYGAVTPTIVYNASVQNNFNGGSVINVGAAGNDFGAANTLVSTTFSGTVDGSSNDFVNLGNAGNDFGAAANALIATSMSGTLTLSQNIISDAQELDFGTDAFGGVGAVVGPRTNDLQIIAASNGAVGRSVILHTQNAVAAGIGNRVARLTITGGAATATATWLSTTHSGFELSAVMTVNGNNTIPIFEDAVRPSNIYTVIITSKSQVTGDINFEGGNLDWTLIESSILGDKYKGLVLIDKPTIVNGKWVFPENYRRIFEVNEQGVFHLGNQLASDKRVSDLEDRIKELETIISRMN